MAVVRLKCVMFDNVEMFFICLYSLWLTYGTGIKSCIIVNIEINILHSIGSISKCFQDGAKAVVIINYLLKEITSDQLRTKFFNNYNPRNKLQSTIYQNGVISIEMFIYISHWT